VGPHNVPGKTSARKKPANNLASEKYEVHKKKAEKSRVPI